MRYAQISYHTCPLASEEGKETGGMNVYVLNLSRQLARLGHQVDVFTRSEDPHAKKIVQVEKNFRVIHLQAGPEKTLPKKELIEYILEFSKSLAKFVGDYDILHAHYYMSGLAVMNILRREWSRPFPTIITFHTLSLLKNLVARSEAEAEPQVRVAAEMELVQKINKIIAPSTVEREYLRYFYGARENKIEIIPPGFDPEIFHPIDKTEARQKIGADPKHKIILFVGRIEPLKGLDVLMYALKILVQKCPDCQICLWIVGGEKQSQFSVFGSRLSDKSSPVVSPSVLETEKLKTDKLISENRQLKTENRDFSKNPELQKLYELRDTLKLHSVIKFVPQQYQHELPFYYNAADVVVMPSHYESFGMSALEAMACGTPVITTNVTGISTIFENSDQHLVISANNPLMLAEAIEKIINRRRPFWASRKKVQDLTWENMAGKMEKVYQNLINSSFPVS